MIQSFILSKNRACQLDLLLRTIQKHWTDYKYHTFNVIYTFTDIEFQKGYDILIDKYKWCKFILENNFKQDLISNISKPEYLTIFTDDDVFNGDFSIEDNEFNIFKGNKDILCLSLRLGKNVISHPERGKMAFPRFSGKNIWTWDWQSVDWGYPMSVSGGHIYRTDEIKYCLQNYEYDKAWNLECALAKNPLMFPKMICYEHSKVFENAINRVQTGFNNAHGNITAEYLNEMFLKGNIIKDDFSDNVSCHEMQEVILARME